MCASYPCELGFIGCEVFIKFIYPVIKVGIGIVGEVDITCFLGGLGFEVEYAEEIGLVVNVVTACCFGIFIGVLTAKIVGEIDERFLVFV